jgi:hypothetical protein
MAVIAKTSNIGVEILAGLGSVSIKKPKIDKIMETPKR